MTKKLVLATLALFGLTAAAGAADVAALVKQLKSSDPETRRDAAKGLGEAGPDAKPAITALADALKDKDLFVRRFAAEALGKIGPDAKSAVKPLTEALGDPKKEVAQAAATALGQIGAVEPLAALVANAKKDTSARRKAIEALGQMKADAKAAVPALTTALKDKDLRVEAADALGEIGPDASSALKELEAIAADKKERDRTFRKAVNDAIKKIKP
jgi:HEAT repeat protein